MLIRLIVFTGFKGNTARPGLVKSPDSTLGLTFEKSRTCLHKTRINKLNSKLDSLKNVVLKALPANL